MLKIFAKLIVLPVMVILIALSFTVSILWHIFSVQKKYWIMEDLWQTRNWFFR